METFFNKPRHPRVIEAYVGEYASGKSENAINRALQLVKEGRKVTLVDLDTVEPFFTLRPIKRQLEGLGIDVIAWETGETMGLGETGSVLKPETHWVLLREGDIILDVGYGVDGAKTLNLIEGARENQELHIYVVVSITRPFTSNVDEIVEYVQSLGTVHGLINNSHLGEDTNEGIIQEGARVITAAATRLGLKVIATAVEDKIRDQIGEYDCMGNPVISIHRFMKEAFW
ncbi:MAG: hypothetical protein ACYCX4_08980 [Bacillota bacterium]